jgi:hypothetical protein
MTISVLAFEYRDGFVPMAAARPQTPRWFLV